ncbi:hypothetical protein FXO38_03034 [Capsicum annuum]|nr:hypothetical protein FXO38_03034 [Capsicum annuum]
MYNPNNDFSDVKDPDTILNFITIFMRQYDWIKNFNHEGRSLVWCKFPFSGHYPWKDDCDCRIYRKRAAIATKPEILIMPLSTSSHTDAYSLNHRSKEDNPTQALKLPSVIQSNIASADPQHAILITALESRLQKIQSKKCPIGSLILYFLDQQQKEMASLEEHMHLMKYDHAKL